ncbi:MAG: ammonium transporter [Clostridiales bacterium]|jgi:Amt family ammonium transporter|nr:ammonium transporter [Clostridiales bacterium]
MDEITKLLEEAVETANEASGAAFAIWFLIGAAMVFFMQCGFAMVESGLTRVKNAGNIIMKNLMDFCIGTLVFMTLGFGLMMGTDYFAGIIGAPNLDIFTNINDPAIASSFVFNLVFAATAATIVSGAMAERTKFSSYCLYSLIISAVIYPIEAGWVWNPEGWLAVAGYIDFAGSSAIHMVGGITALIGAIFLGPRLGKYRKQKDGSTKSVAIPGHNLAIAALGVFILWFGWYGFNGAAATDISQLARIFVNTTIAPAMAAITAMMYTWIKNKKPDVSMSLNGALAGLVAITAGCLAVDALGATVIGLIAGVIVVAAVEFLDLKLHIDDPVGAVAVHGVNGIFGTVAVGLFATEGGLFYGGGFTQLGWQILGVLAIAAWTAATMTLVFYLIKKFGGLRVSKEEEIKGLDITEHGLVSAYAGFSTTFEDLYDGIEVDVDGLVSVDDAVPVQVKSAKTVASDVKISKVEIICKETRFEALKEAMNKIGVNGMTITKVLGCGAQKGQTEKYRGADVEITLLPKIQVEIIVCKVPVKTVVDTAKKALYTGNIGDGKIFVYDVENVIRVRTGEEGYDALQDLA